MQSSKQFRLQDVLKYKMPGMFPKQDRRTAKEPYFISEFPSLVGGAYPATSRVLWILIGSEDVPFDKIAIETRGIRVFLSLKVCINRA